MDRNAVPSSLQVIAESGIACGRRYSCMSMDIVGPERQCCQISPPGGRGCRAGDDYLSLLKKHEIASLKRVQCTSSDNMMSFKKESPLKGGLKCFRCYGVIVCIKS
jgi:hypothetical protein